jgi:hypothetical protein
VPVPPEVEFDRYVRGHTPYSRGKQDLDRLDQPGLQSLLTRIQGTLNEALLNERRDVPEHVDHPPLHLDYIDSDTSNALAPPPEDYSFIGLTMGLIYQLDDLCVRLSRSEAVAALLGVEITPDVQDLLQAMLFYNLLHFVVAHEYTHHVHGHSKRRGADSLDFSEIEDNGETGNLEEQVMEADADDYAAYHVLANLIDTGERALAVAALKLEEKDATLQDEVLFSCFVVAVGAFLLARPPVDVDKANVYKLTHPPQAARLNYLMESAIAWCRQNRPSLAAWMTKDRFQRIMKAAAEATWGVNGGLTWEAQITFFQSEAGAEYIRKLGESLKAYAAAL